ncbi:MAG: cardiolipin synthase ClsB [Polyangiaceae bacterium]|nr:cardiolipin synthase ClsB [Polyangiaceae bacterium]
MVIAEPVSFSRHTVRVLRNGTEFFSALFEAVGAARQRIRVEMYWWGDDAIGRRARSALAEAARRGVDVKVLVDGFGSMSLPRGFWDELARAGGQVRTFRPPASALLALHWHAAFARDHRKIVVCDARSIVGGVNIALPWAARSDGGGDWRDTALEVDGEPTAAHLRTLFDAAWEPRGLRRGAPTATGVAWTDGDGSGRGLGILSNVPSARRQRRIRQAYLWAIRASRRSIDITCAYFAPRPVFLRALARAVERGVSVRLLVPLRSDVPFVRYASLPQLRWLSRRGVEVYGYGGGILHAKTAVVDGEWCTVGSHNLDGLSWAWNLECNIMARSGELAGRLVQLFQEDLCLSVRWPPPEVGFFEAYMPAALRRWYSRG